MIVRRLRGQIVVFQPGQQLFEARVGAEFFDIVGLHQVDVVLHALTALELADGEAAHTLAEPEKALSLIHI